MPLSVGSHQGSAVAAAAPIAPEVVRLARLATAMLLIGAGSTVSYVIALLATS